MIKASLKQVFYLPVWGMPWVYSATLRLSARPVAYLLVLLGRSLRQCYLPWRTYSHSFPPSPIKPSTWRKKKNRPWHNSNPNSGHWKHIRIVPSPLFQLGNVTGLQNFHHASLLDGSTHSGGCTGTRVLEGGPQSAAQLPHVDRRRMWHSTWEEWASEAPV